MQRGSGVVIDAVANLYSEPTATVDLVTQAVLGTGVELREDRGDWCRAGLPDHYEGWIEARHVHAYDPGEEPYASAGQVTEVRALLAFLYHEPDVSHRAPALQVTLGTRIELIEVRDERWLRVALPNGSDAWIQRGDVDVVDATAERLRSKTGDLIATARRFLGLPYLWGGSTPLGIDCSGFVQLVYHLHGVELLRDAHLQYDQAGLVPVARGALAPGDLLFFGSSSITHVGLHMRDGEFIHATTHERPVVQISQLEQPYWTALYRGARRP